MCFRKWKKGTGQITGYQLRWSRKADMTGAKKKNIKSKKKLSYKKGKLESGSKYYVQIRTYKTVKGVNYYSKWSKKKTVKAK